MWRKVKRCGDIQHIDEHGPSQRCPFRRLKNAGQPLFCEAERLDRNNDGEADHLDAPRCDTKFNLSEAAASMTSRASWIFCIIVVMTVGMTKVWMDKSRASL